MLTTLPDQDAARNLARQLVEARLAACVNILAPCTSVYHWQGVLNEDGEIPVIIKSTATNYSRIEAFIRAHHPYELPELITIDITNGLLAYLAWVAAETLETS